MDKPLLSICIPTYNRCEYLGRCLDSIISQKKFIDGDVEVVVSDNASTDNTQELVERYTSRYHQIKYYKNERNIIAYNYPLAISRGNGIYRKLMNDTFLIYEGGLKCLCDLIKEHRKTHEQLFFLNKNRPSITQEMIECEDFDQFAKTACTWTTWNGAFGLWDVECEGIENDTDGCDVNLWVCKQVYERVNDSGSAIICNKRIFGYQSRIKPKDLTYGVFGILYVQFLNILNEYLTKDALSQETYNGIRKEDLYVIMTDELIASEINPRAAIYSNSENLKQLVFEEAKANFDWNEYYSYYKKRKITKFFKLHIKRALKYFHIWDVIVALHIRDQ